MISPFEATLLGVVAPQPVSRYEVMKAIQSQSLYWSGTPGAVYSALVRLKETDLIEEVGLTDPKLYRITELGKKAYSFLTIPVSPDKLILDPSVVRMKIRGLQNFSAQERITFYFRQVTEYSGAFVLVIEKRGASGNAMDQELSNLVVGQLRLEVDLMKRRLAKELDG
ncbi:MAG: PadR family transcriptional regulator [Bacillota bacterium]|jgi:DNA-binding PadR family transcriptional regulator|nr:PadR family transcriptional regulator [Bacillota bacterium]HHT91865.1 PadR family transcriptional regulator [Bacillota bacterium]